MVKQGQQSIIPPFGLTSATIRLRPFAFGILPFDPRISEASEISLPLAADCGTHQPEGEKLGWTKGLQTICRYADRRLLHLPIAAVYVSSSCHCESRNLSYRKEKSPKSKVSVQSSHSYRRIRSSYPPPFPTNLAGRWHLVNLLNVRARPRPRQAMCRVCWHLFRILSCWKPWRMQRLLWPRRRLNLV